MTNDLRLEFTPESSEANSIICPAEGYEGEWFTIIGVRDDIGRMIVERFNAQSDAQLSNCKSSLRAVEAELDEARARAQGHCRDADFNGRACDEQKKRAERAEELADKYKWQVRDTCARAEKAEQELVEARAAHKKSTHEAVRRLRALGREKYDVETQLLDAESREKQVRAETIEECAKVADAAYASDNLADRSPRHIAQAIRALASKEGGG